MCKMFEYGVKGGIYRTRWNEGWYETFGHKIPSKKTKENVLYRGSYDLFITLHNGKLIGLQLTRGAHWTLLHKQIHHLIEIEGLTVYDAFKVMVL